MKRSLLLPAFFTSHCEPAEYIFAPNPAVKHYENHGDKNWYCYVRPLATIEPTAITLGVPVNTMFGLDDTEQLVNELMKPKYHNATIYIAWEHARIVDIARKLMQRMKMKTVSIPTWRDDDYNMVFVFTIEWNKTVGDQVTFSVMNQNLTNLVTTHVAPAYLE